MCERPQAFKTITRKARKNHKCCECHQHIYSGTEYQYSSGIWEGEPNSYKQCLNCYSIMIGAIKIVDTCDEGIPFEGLRDFFIGYVCSDFKGVKFLTEMASDIGVTADELNMLLKIEEL